MAYIGVSPSNGVRRVHTYTATASQTTFSGAGAEGTSLSYKDSNFVDVYQNGVKLGDADYTSTSGTSIVLAQGASVDDLVVVVVFDVFSVADTVSKADGGTFDGAVTFAGTATFSGSVVGISSAADDITAGDAAVNLTTTSGNITIDAQGNDTDIIFKGTDNSSDITMLTLDGSEAGAATFNGDVTIPDKIIHSGDTDTTIRFPAANTVSFETAGSERLRINDDGNVLIGRTSELYDFGDGRTSLVLQGSGSQDYSTIQLANNGTGSNNQILGLVAFYDGTNENARIQAQRGDGTDVGDLLFSTRSSGGSLTESMRLYRTGSLAIGMTEPTGKLQVNTANMGNLDALVLKNETNNVNGYFVRFRRSSNAEIGSIEQTGGGATVSYNTSSDYRLKESVNYDFDATTRLKQLKPARFNFIGDTATVDGFLAHEVSDIVPHAISGKKDAMTKEVLYVDGDEIPEGKKVGDVKEESQIAPQGIDHSKLVPLLTKTLQEALTRIDTLEAEVKALKGE